MTKVDLYDPKFVHFAWDESLRGKKGFRADDIGILKSTIRDTGITDMGTLIGFKDENAPFIVRLLREDHPSYWKFFYYDPHYEVKWAYFKERKAIQRKCKRTMTWYDVGVGYDDVSFFEDDGYDYRVKPEEESKKEPKTDVDVNVNIKNSSNVGSVKIIINGKECIFESIEQATAVLRG
jgi:hypothetical protein